MLATVLTGTIVFSFAILGLSMGVIFSKKTPLKTTCHAASDGGHEGACACGAGTAAAGSDEQKTKALVEGRFDLTAVKKGNFIKL
jgi:hypothetical protein